MRNPKRNRKQRPLEMVLPNAAGIDIGANEHWVCGPAVSDEKRPVRQFGATTSQLDEMAAWLKTLGVTTIAMESTYIYWIPAFEVLEQAGFEVLLVNARTLKNVPGRKTDVQDCQWIQRLHSCGLLRGSFRPREDLCQLRTLHRQRANLVAERTRTVHWMQKALDHMNVRVHRAVSHLTGVTGMAIVRAIVQGERDPLVLAGLRDKRCRKSEQEIAEQLTGTWRTEHLFNLESALELHDHLEQQIARYDAEMQRLITSLTPKERTTEEVPKHPTASKAKAIRQRGEEPLREALCRFAGVDLTTIDGISPEAARVIISEIGASISAFPTEKCFVSWLGLCPNTPVSGGKPLKRKRKNLGASRVGNVLRMAATSPQRSRSALGAAFRRIARRKSGAIAVMAVARKLATIVYRLLRFGQAYVDIGADTYEMRFAERRLAALETNANQLGLKLVPITDT